MNNNKIKRVTRKDVAKAAGVSTTTVTHSLTDNPATRISKDTRDKVKRIAKELGYRPNFTGRILIDGKNYNIGIIQPAPGSMLSSFYQHIIYGAAEVMQGSDYHLSLFFAGNSKCFDMLRQGRVDGVFLLDSRFENKNIETLVDMNIPTVVLNRGIPESCKNDTVAVHSDNRLMINDVIDDFQKSGCKNILAIHNYRDSYANQEIFQEFSKRIGNLASDGIIGATIEPDRKDVSEQFHEILTSGQKWDAIYMDGRCWVDCFISEAEKCGLELGKDYKLIVSHTEDIPEYIGKDIITYIQQPELVGEMAWSVMNKLWSGNFKKEEFLVPYKKMM